MDPTRFIPAWRVPGTGRRRRAPGHGAGGLLVRARQAGHENVMTPLSALAGQALWHAGGLQPHRPGRRQVPADQGGLWPRPAGRRADCPGRTEVAPNRGRALTRPRARVYHGVFVLALLSRGSQPLALHKRPCDRIGSHSETRPGQPPTKGGGTPDPRDLNSPGWRTFYPILRGFLTIASVTTFPDKATVGPPRS